MRLVIGLLAVTLGSFASIASADDTPSAPPPVVAVHPKVPLRVVRVMPTTHQALLFDRELNKDVLAELGGTIDGYRVDDIADDEVTLSRAGAQVVLAAPDQSWRRRMAARVSTENSAEAGEIPMAAKAPAVAMVEAPTAPIASPIAGEAAPLDPYAEPGDTAPVRAVEAPAAIGAGAVRTIEAPGAKPADAAVAAEQPTPAVVVTMTAVPVPPPASATPPSVSVSASATPPPASASATPPPASASATPPPVSASATPPSVSASAAPPPVSASAAPPPVSASATPPPASAAVTVAAEPAANTDGLQSAMSRKEIAAAMGDFGKLTGSIRGAFTPGGARVDSLAADSLFAHAGLRAGDVITAVDGQPLGSIDDAAELYVRVSTARNVTIDLVRAGKPATLHVAIQ